MTANQSTAEVASAKMTTLRDQKGIALTKEVRSAFPAVFASKPSSALSADYQFYPSIQLIEDLDNAGMQLVSLGQQISRKRDPAHQFHIMRFQPKEGSDRARLRVGDSTMELVIANSHNGRARFQAYAGIFRLVCLNGMIVSDLDLGQVRQKHFGGANTFDHIKALVAAMADRTMYVNDKIAAWQALELSDKDQTAFAKACMAARDFPDWLEPDQLLIERREDEAADDAGKRDLWTTFNVIQENVMKGDIDRMGSGHRPAATRAVTGAKADLAVNTALWSALEAFSEAKGIKKVVIPPLAVAAIEAETSPTPDAAGEKVETKAQDGATPETEAPEATNETSTQRRNRLKREKRAAEKAAAQA